MATTRKVTASAPRSGKSKPRTDSMHEQIAVLAYLKSEARGFVPGHELDDWLEAEKEVNGSGGPQRKH